MTFFAIYDGFVLWDGGIRCGRGGNMSIVLAVGDRATSYYPRFAADPRYGPDPNRDLDYSGDAGASVFVSTPSDLVRFGVAINSGQLLQPATVQLLQSSQRLPSGQETGYGASIGLPRRLYLKCPQVIARH